MKLSKNRDLVFLLFIATLIVALSFVPEMHITDDIVLSRNELWKLGFGPLFIILGLFLAVVTIQAKNGSNVGYYLCLWWAAIYTLLVGSLTVWHYPNIWQYIVIFGLIWSVAWYFSIRVIWSHDGV